MRHPIFLRELTEEERGTLEQGLRSSDAFVLRRCQILLASTRGARAPQIALQLGCDDQTVLNALHAFNAQGLAALRKGSTRPHRTRPAFAPEHAERLRVLLQRSPRAFGKPTSVWTLNLVAEVSVEQGLTPVRVSDETIRQTLQRLGINWKRAKHWITSPDAGYARKKADATV
ncbi:MAG: helix-turn-helix domain-containing protein [Ktedonobacterales bacterium]